MKTTIKLIATFVLLALFKISIAQIPQGINYQATIRDASGNLMQNQSVDFIFSLRESTASGTVVYSETQTLTTNNYGGVAAVIGQGTPTLGSFSSLSWQNKHFLNVNADGNDLGTSQFQSVPYALYANEADYAHDATDAEYADVAGEISNPVWKKKQSNGSVFITETPVIIGDSMLDAQNLTVSIPKLTFQPELVDLKVDSLSSNRDVLNIYVGNNSVDNGQFIECNKGSSTNFKVNVDGSVETKSRMKIDGELNNATTGTANLIPIAYGLIGYSGGVFSSASTSNVSCVKTAIGVYEITIANENLTSTNCIAITTITGLSPAMAIESISAGKLIVHTWHSDGNATSRGFQFVVYKK